MNEPSSSTRRLRAIVSPESVRLTRQLALAGNYDQALALTREKLQYDLPVIDVLAALVLPVLREIGELWHVNAIGHHDQALASRVMDHVLDAVWPASPVTQARGAAVIVAAPEGEQHTLGGRVATLALQADGWSVLDLGADVSAADVDAAIMAAADLQGIVLHSAATSCLPSALQLIDVAARHGRPVVVAGRGFGEMGRYGVQLGASGWAERPGVTLSAQLLSAAPARSLPGAQQRESCAEVQHRAAAFAGGPCPFAEVMPADATGPIAPGPFLAADLAAAVLIDEPEVLTGAVDWYCDFLTARGVSPVRLIDVFAALSSSMSDIPGCGSMLAAGRAVLA